MAMTKRIVDNDGEYNTRLILQHSFRNNTSTKNTKTTTVRCDEYDNIVDDDVNNAVCLE